MNKIDLYAVSGEKDFKSNSNQSKLSIACAYVQDKIIFIPHYFSYLVFLSINIPSLRSMVSDYMWSNISLRLLDTIKYVVFRLTKFREV